MFAGFWRTFMLVLLAALIITYLNYDDQAMQIKLDHRFIENEASAIAGKD